VALEGNIRHLAPGGGRREGCGGGEGVRHARSLGSGGGGGTEREAGSAGDARWGGEVRSGEAEATTQQRSGGSVVRRASR